MAAAAVPISRCSVPGSRAIPIAMAGLGMMAVVRLAGPAPVQHPPHPSWFASTLLRQPTAVTVGSAALEGSARGACVVVLGGSEKVSVGSEAQKRATIVSLS